MCENLKVALAAVMITDVFPTAVVLVTANKKNTIVEEKNGVVIFRS